jgi:hypothetical protein
MTTYNGWTESDEAVQARMDRRNAEHEAIMKQKNEQETIQIELPTSAAVLREG